ncbi:CopD family protein [Aquibaculum arenosum]|uniref:CopD family protein n=1 Tax=Aquibaculum arenosum TaxID=3032591 RepID=A0ABT5YT86_9PROT|nr:CopD family protein [Fodinicurvata sp. CAU 1616]MDF2097419.1 CopD family protein [Fodinicurvata sp. CAU 1616]
MLALLLALHALAAVVWVGGMFFAYLILRPSLGSFEAPQRLRLWHGVFGRFFPWVWAAVGILLASGYAMIFGHFGGFSGVGVPVHIMHLTGLIMMALFAHLFFAPWRRFRQAVEREDFAAAGQQLNGIRRIVAINLALGLLTVILGAGGRYW